MPDITKTDMAIGMSIKSLWYISSIALQLFVCFIILKNYDGRKCLFPKFYIKKVCKHNINLLFSFRLLLFLLLPYLLLLFLLLSFSLLLPSLVFFNVFSPNFLASSTLSVTMTSSKMVPDFTCHKSKPTAPISP
ncbi:unnamed protein product [Brugia timori]|uniref:Ovule protein n=1 Tax=Brugia timori TaxID=42155 RepID=A0A0R3Q6Z3_9BILA|nr:unnamed protein product [Brugia timori]